jgi:hypothetical protein
MRRPLMAFLASLVLGFGGTTRSTTHAQEAVVVPNGTGGFISFAFPAQAPIGQQPGQVAPRDAQQPVKPGTATLRGRVIAGDLGQPLRRAQVRLQSTGPFTPGQPPDNRLATTDASGRYEFKEVRAGRYIVTASKAGPYVTVAYGQQRQTDPSKPIDVLEGQTVEKIDFSLPLGGVITGRILDEFGDPVADVQVAAVRNMYSGGTRRLLPSGRAGTTNDIGEFRIFALPPGDYYVSATIRNAINLQQETDDRSGYAPTYYPGTAELAGAQKLTVAAGQTMSGITLALLPIRTARVSGTAFNSRGEPIRGLVIATPRDGLQPVGPGASPGQVRPDGSFAILGLTPGDYWLLVQGQTSNGPDAEYASADITVTGTDINNVRIVSAKPSTMTGRITFASGDPSSLKPSTIRVGAQPAPAAGFTGPVPPPVALHDDWSFESTVRPGMMRLSLVALPSSSWIVKAIRYRGADIIDTGLEVRPNEDVTSIEVELTDRISNVSGAVTNGRGEAVKDYWTVVFARDRDKWAPPSRYIRTSRGDQDGRFKMTGLPPGDYVALALETLEPGESNDPEVLDRMLRSRPISFSIGEGETKALELKLSSLH